MFLKPIKVKSNCQLKATERKKLCGDVLAAFPSLSDDQVQNLFPKKEAITSMKVVTHSGEVCKLYCVARLPMFFQPGQFSTTLFPTIFTLWQHPELLYAFKTHYSVLTKLGSGADLMLPGVILKGPATLSSFGKLAKNTPVSVITDDNRAAIAVGVTAHSSEDLYMSGGRGKCVSILHVMGDQLCQMGKEPPARPQLSLDASQVTPESPGDDENSPKVPLNVENPLESCENNLQSLNLTNNDDEATFDEALQSDSVEDKVLIDPVKEMDQLLEYCFLKACKLMKKTDLPVLSSNFFKNYLIPACPSGQTVDIKKSGYKKLSVFLASMKAQGVIDTTILKGVESVTHIQAQHPLLKDLVINEDSEPTQPTQSSNIPIVSECYKVTADVLPILSIFGYEKGDIMKRPEIRQCFADYVKRENLQDGKILNINPQLAGTLRTKESVVSLTMEDGINKFIGRMTHTHEITIGNTRLLHTGKLEPIEITVATRGSNKKVTLISNLEAFGIKLDEFSKECQNIGASATTTDVPGKKIPSVLVQGNQVLYVHKLLTEKYRINKNYIRGLEFAPKRRK